MKGCLSTAAADDVVPVAAAASSDDTARAFARGLGNLTADVPENHRKDFLILQDQVTDDLPQHPDAKGRMAVFCSTCFRRGFQVKRVLPWNLLTMMQYRDVVRYDLMLFNPDDPDTKDVLEFVRQNLGWAVKTGLLRIGVAPMEWWSCPEAKNTAHVFATTHPEGFDRKKRFLVNVDRTLQPESSQTRAYVRIQPRHKHTPNK